MQVPEYELFETVDLFEEKDMTVTPMFTRLNKATEFVF
jgi:hypothetical protein